MIKFKDLLREDNDELSEAKMLNRRIHDFKNENKQLMYRSDEVFVQTWHVESIRKNRSPLDTGRGINAIIRALEEVNNTNPKRKESKFAVGGERQRELGKYSGIQYICFPHNKANVYSLKHDAYIKYFQTAEDNLETAFDKWLSNDLSLGDPIDSFFRAYDDVKRNSSSESYTNLYRSVVKKWKALKRRVGELTGRMDSNLEEEILHHLHEFFSSVESYFDDLKKGYSSQSSEIIFDGPSFLLIDEGFFKKFFDWRNGEWQIKKEYDD